MISQTTIGRKENSMNNWGQLIIIALSCINLILIIGYLTYQKVSYELAAANDRNYFTGLTKYQEAKESVSSSTLKRSLYANSEIGAISDTVEERAKKRDLVLDELIGAMENQSKAVKEIYEEMKKVDCLKLSQGYISDCINFKVELEYTKKSYTDFADLSIARYRDQKRKQLDQSKSNSSNKNDNIAGSRKTVEIDF
jgi:hypothetical protein